MYSNSPSNHLLFFDHAPFFSPKFRPSRSGQEIQEKHSEDEVETFPKNRETKITGDSVPSLNQMVWGGRCFGIQIGIPPKNSQSLSFSGIQTESLHPQAPNHPVFGIFFLMLSFGPHTEAICLFTKIILTLFTMAAVVFLFLTKNEAYVCERKILGA